MYTKTHGNAYNLYFGTMNMNCNAVIYIYITIDFVFISLCHMRNLLHFIKIKCYSVAVEEKVR